MPRPMLPARIILPAAVMALGAVLAACVPDGNRVDARQDYMTFCATCHGDAGRGDGPLAASLTPHPADLTTISARNDGVFPTTRVMSVIDGYTRGQHGNGGPMPEFGDLLDGRQVLYDDGLGGPPVPVPERLRDLASYVEGLQR